MCLPFEPISSCQPNLLISGEQSHVLKQDMDADFADNEQKAEAEAGSSEEDCQSQQEWQLWLQVNALASA